MPRITKIESQKRNPRRWSVFLDGKFAFGLDEEVLYKYGLKEGEELGQNKIEKIIQTETKKEAKDVSLRLLSYRMRSEREIRDKLKRKEFTKEIIDEVIENLKRMNLLDDYEFTSAWIRDRLSNNPRGKALLKQELYRKGIKEDIIKKTLKEYFSDETEELSLAKKLLDKRKKRYENLEPNVAKRRMSDFLLRRGFSYDIVKQVLKLEKNSGV
ncbi:MAG: RecX family transcriptional regulator [candidate division Zixibacteria bacterium]|nr:RecX family transcriptional regulator [candidate division Zixibacteria bacterium]